MIDQEIIKSRLKNPVNYFKYWKEIVIIFMLALFVFTYWRLNQQKKNLQLEISRRDAVITSGAINSGTTAVTEREEKVYPKIDADINTLNKNIKDVKNKLNKLEKTKPTKEKSYANFKNNTATNTSEYFTSRGFTNTIVNSVSK